jgi:membrane-associated phospholipid phosphatase
MDAILNWGIAWILFFQNLGSWLIVPMQFLSFLGHEYFFLFIAPVLFWCVDATLGLRIGLGLLASLSINGIIKLAFHAPRPYWYDARIQPYSTETSFGFPSGHAQNAVVLWGLLASWFNRPLGWIIATTLILLISLSRMVLGVHFPSDALAGWIVGIMLVWAILHFEKPVLSWFRKRQLTEQTLILFGISMATILIGVLTRLSLGSWTLPSTWVELAARVPDAAPIAPLALSNVVSPAASFFGMGLGATLLYKSGWFDARGTILQRVARFLIGTVGVFIIWYGLDQIFPDGDTLIPLCLRYLRYAAVGIWITYLAPLIFFRIHLALLK